MATSERVSLTAGDWTAAALQSLARGGLAAVAVEPLAKQLGTTKGSFYWHFADRNALIADVLDLWESRDTERVIAAVERGGDTTDRLRTLLRVAFTSVQIDPTDDQGSVELALQATASHPLVAAALARVTQRRLRYLTSLFTDLGMSPARARDRALLAYTAFLGHAQLAHATPELLPQGRAAAVHVRRIIDALVGDDASGA